MAYEGQVQIIPGRVAGADLSTKQYYFCTELGAGNMVLAGAGANADGVLQNNPDTAGKPADVAYGGVTKMVAGAAIAKGAEIMIDAAGKGITATATNHIMGRTLEAAAADGNIISIILSKAGVKA